MKTILHNITAVFLSLLVLSSSTTYGINTHICGDSVYSISLYGNADGCEMEMDNCQVVNENLNTVSEESCCNDVNIIIENQTFHQVNDIEFYQNQIYFSTSFLTNSQNLYQLFKYTKKGYTNYYYPQINKDIYILYEVFLI